MTRTAQILRLRWTCVTIVCLLFALILLYLLPLLSAFFSKESYTRFLGFLLYNEQGGIAFARTLIFASTVCVLEVLLGFVGGVILRRIQAFTAAGRTLSILLFPVLLGNLSIAFIFKIQFMNSSWFERAIASRSFVSVWSSLFA